MFEALAKNKDSLADMPKKLESILRCIAKVSPNLYCCFRNSSIKYNNTDKSKHIKAIYYKLDQIKTEIIWLLEYGTPFNDENENASAKLLKFSSIT